MARETKPRLPDAVGNVSREVTTATLAAISFVALTACAATKEEKSPAVVAGGEYYSNMIVDNRLNSGCADGSPYDLNRSDGKPDATTVYDEDTKTLTVIPGGDLLHTGKMFALTFYTNDEGRIIGMNPWTAALLGYEPNEGVPDAVLDCREEIERMGLVVIPSQ